MGNVFVDNYKPTRTQQRQLAYDIYVQRVKDYDPTIHGNRTNYMQCMQAQYRLDCFDNLTTIDTTSTTTSSNDILKDNICYYNEVV